MQQNVAKFGGDPRNVTIFGESAGGSSVCDQIASPTAAGLFKHAISTSGEYNTLLGAPTLPRSETQDCKSALPSQAQADAAGAGFAAAVGCWAPPTWPPACGVPAADARDHVRLRLTRTAVRAPLADHQRHHAHDVAAAGAADRPGKPGLGHRRDGPRRGPGRDADHGASTPRSSNPVRQSRPRCWPATRCRTSTRRHRVPYGRRGLRHVCPSLITDRDLARWMPVYGYEIDDDDIPPYAAGAVPHGRGASHVGAWFLNPVSPALDANQQALQDEEVASVTHFARTGNPTATGTPDWPEFTVRRRWCWPRPGQHRHRSVDHGHPPLRILGPGRRQPGGLTQRDVAGDADVPGHSSRSGGAYWPAQRAMASDRDAAPILP